MKNKKFSQAVASLGMVSPQPRNLLSLYNWWGLTLLQCLGKPHRVGYRVSVYQFATACRSILTRHGVNALILRLKVSLIVTQQFLSGTPCTNSEPLGVRIALANGLPKMYPKAWRSALRAKNPWVIRWVLSLVNSFKAFKGEYGDPSVASISATPFEGDLSAWKAFIPEFWKFANWAKIPFIWHQNTPLILSAGPNCATSTFGAADDAKAWSFQRSNWAKAFFDALGAYEYSMMMDLLSRRSSAKAPILGKLSLKYEAAGKVRVFAICDYWTQAALRPLHDWMFSLLRGIPTDGTFDQLKAVTSLAGAGHKEFYSYDLSSATDMIPIQLYVAMLEPVLGQKLTSIWAKLMVDRDFKLPWMKEFTTVRYTRGQPMGAYSSWAVLALCHHGLVQFSAKRVGLKLPFVAYRVLGDDIVIAHSTVAAEYLKVCEEFGIPVGLAKSFTSKEAFFNFANKTFLGQENLSPASLKELLVAKKLGLSALLEFASRQLHAGWLVGTVPNILRLVVSPNHWSKKLTGEFNSTREISRVTRKALLGALWPTSPLAREIGTKSSLLVRVWLKALRPTVRLLTAQNSDGWVSPETDRHETRALYEWVRQEIAAIKRANESNKTNAPALHKFFSENLESWDVGPLVSTVWWTRDGLAWQRAQKVMERVFELDRMSKLPLSVDSRSALIRELLDIRSSFPILPSIGDMESFLSWVSSSPTKVKPSTIGRQVRRVENWLGGFDSPSEGVSRGSVS